MKNGVAQKILNFDAKYNEQIAWELTEGKPEIRVAFIQHKGQIFYSLCRRQGGPSSATVKLIQGLFDQNKDLSFFILRNRIYCSEEIGPMAKGMVKVAAKRISEIRPRDHGLKVAETPCQVGEAGDFFYSHHPKMFLPLPQLPAFIKDEMDGIKLCLDLAARVPRGEVLHDFNRAIAAVLCDRDGKLLSWATNSAFLNKTLHAEVLMVQKYFQASQNLIPPNAQIFVSLKPCLMCAGLIAESCADLSSLSVYFAQEDTGPLARCTAIEKNLIHLKV